MPKGHVFVDRLNVPERFYPNLVPKASIKGVVRFMDFGASKIDIEKAMELSNYERFQSAFPSE